MSTPAPVQLPVDGGGGRRIEMGRELAHPPRDGISNLRFSRNSDRLIVSSWEKMVRLFDVQADQANVLKGVFTHKTPVLDCCFHDNTAGFSASSDNVVRRISFGDCSSYRLGTHDRPVRCVEYSYTTGQVISGSWDSTIKCWDPRGADGPQEKALIGTHNQPGRVYSLSLAGHRLVVPTAEKHVNVYDLRNMVAPEQQRKSYLKYQTRCVECYPDGTGFALGSVEGRVAMEYFDPSESGLYKRYSFKCHRLDEGRGRAVYPVNAITFHPTYGTLATGGCDGYVYTWDGDNQKRLFQYPRYETSIAALSFSRDGSLLAVASSYTYERGHITHPTDKIFIREVNEFEVKPRHGTNLPPRQ
ncbi:unnamed protein product [Alopecurus aequalis]